jgi:peptidylprolyl isomerase
MKRLLLFGLIIMVAGCGGEDPKIRGRLLEIAQWEDRGTVGPDRDLATLLYHSDLEVRRQAVLALGRVADVGSIQEIEAARETLDTPYVRADAAWSMSQLAAQYDSDIPEQFLNALYRDTSTIVRLNVMDGMGHLEGAEVEQFLQIFGLLDGNPSTRSAAALACGRLASLQDPRDLIGLFRDQDPEVRWPAAWALWRLKEARAKGALEAALRDDDARVRMFAARALAEVGDATSADSLAPLLEDADWRVRNNAALAIGRIGGENDRVIDLLVARLQAEQHELVAQTAAEAVGRAGRPGDVAALKALVRRRSGTIWKGAINGLADHHPDSAWEFVLAMALDPRLGVSQTAIAALGRIGSEPVRHYLVTTYDDPDLDDTRKGLLLGALTEFGFEHVEFYIDEALQSDDLVLALTAAEALSMRVDTSSTRRLEAFWTRHVADTISNFKLTALQTASALIDSQVVLGRLMEPWLRAALEDEDRLVRKEAVDALANMGVDVSARVGEFASQVNEDTFDDIFRAFKSNPTATIETDHGTIQIELRYDKAPRTVYNFVALTRDGFYDGLTFHRVVPNFVVQGGDPDGTGYGGPGYSIRSQYNDLSYTTGAVGMASSGKDTEGSQFFITHSPQPHLDDRYTIFGYVTSGQDVVDAVRQGDKITSISIR